MTREDVSGAIPPLKAPGRFPHPTRLIVGCTILGVLLLAWVVVYSLLALLPVRDNWALYFLAAVVAAMVGALVGVLTWARHVFAWANAVATWQAEITQQVRILRATVERQAAQFREEPKQPKAPEA